MEPNTQLTDLQRMQPLLNARAGVYLVLFFFLHSATTSSTRCISSAWKNSTSQLSLHLLSAAATFYHHYHTLSPPTRRHADFRRPRRPRTPQRKSLIKSPSTNHQYAALLLRLCHFYYSTSRGFALCRMSGGSEEQQFGAYFYDDATDSSCINLH